MRYWLYAVLLVALPLGALAAPATKHEPAKRLYDRVMEEFQRHDYEAALAGFRFFLEVYGQTRLASSAQYWIGESELRLGRYRQAVASFDVLAARYPTSPKLPASAYKKALAYRKLGFPREARTLLERVIAQFPRSPEAQLARKTLKSLEDSEPAVRVTRE